MLAASAPRVPSVLPTKKANSLVALREVLGSTSVGMMETKTSSTRGDRVSGPAQVKVSSRGIELMIDYPKWSLVRPLSCVHLLSTSWCHLFTAATPKSVTRESATPVCAKCAPNSQGRLTCCAEGGTWFNKCGYDGDYTWAQGFQACKNAGLREEAQSQVKLTQKVAQHQIMDSTDLTKSNYIDLTNLTIMAVLFLADLYLQI